MTTFSELGLSNAILKSTDALGYEEPTPIQRDAIPVALDGHDIMGLAQTGTGKTAAFGLPLIHHLLKDDSRPQPRSIGALIVAPTRELVKQIGDNLREFTRRTPLKVNIVVGGASIHFQKKKLEKGTDILVATPGRLMDLVDRKAVFLDSARYLVLDEADQMLDLGFIHTLRKIAKMVGSPRQTFMFSATMPKQISELAKAFLTDPVRIEVARAGKAADKVTQCVHFVGQGDKSGLLRKILNENPDNLSLVFARTKHGAEKLMKRLVEWGFSANSIHGNKSQGQRERAIKAFKAGETRILVATDVAARGIDIPGVTHVFNFDLPDVPENYVHRIGRTARAGREGEAIAFCAPSELHLLGNIEKLMELDITVASGERPQGSFTKKKGSGRNQRGRGGNNSNERRARKGPPRGKKRFGEGGRDKPSVVKFEYEGSEQKQHGDGGEKSFSKNKRPGRNRSSGEKKEFGEVRERFNARGPQTSEEGSGKPRFKKSGPKFKGRAGKKRGKKKQVAA